MGDGRALSASMLFVSGEAATSMSNSHPFMDARDGSLNYEPRDNILPHVNYQPRTVPSPRRLRTPQDTFDQGGGEGSSSNPKDAAGSRHPSPRRPTGRIRRRFR